MSKYNLLWEYVHQTGSPLLKLTFNEIKDIAGIPMDHSFLNYSMSKALYDRVYIWKRRISKEGLFFMEQVPVTVVVAVAVRPVVQPVPPHGSLGFQQGLAGV